MLQNYNNLIFTRAKKVLLSLTEIGVSLISCPASAVAVLFQSLPHSFFQASFSIHKH